MSTLSLPPDFAKQLIKLPETGMGYQLVKVILKNGRVLRHLKVINASMIIVSDQELFTKNDIARIEPE